MGWQIIPEPEGYKNKDAVAFRLQAKRGRCETLLEDDLSDLEPGGKIWA